MELYGDAAQSDEETRVGEVGSSAKRQRIGDELADGGGAP